MVSSLMAIRADRAEHSVPLWHPVVAAFPGANTISELPKSIKVSTPDGAKQIQPFTATDCYSLSKVSNRFIAVCARNIHIATPPLSFVLSHQKTIPSIRVAIAIFRIS
jgi:hypothetical protein